MPKTGFALGLNTAAESWRTIRSVRAEPPAAIMKLLQEPDRAETFHTALEQSQQQFTAATAVGYESRPLNLYYGASQATRALAAASGVFAPSTSPDCRTWGIQGHGLKTTTEVPDPARFFDVTVRPEKANTKHVSVDMFSRLSSVLGSPLDIGPISLGAIVSQLPEFSMEFGQEGDAWPELHLMPVATGPLSLGEPPYDLELRLPGLPPTGEVAVEEIRAVLDHYPAVRDFDPTLLTGGVRRSSGTDRFRVSIPRRELLTIYDYQTAYPAAATLYRRHWIALPALGSSREALGPLASWTLVLYVLSMVARYAPDSWTRALALRTSPVASKIEFLLDAALDAVPDLLAEALMRLE